MGPQIAWLVVSDVRIAQLSVLPKTRSRAPGKIYNGRKPMFPDRQDRGRHGCPSRQNALTDEARTGTGDGTVVSEGIRHVRGNVG